MIKASLIKGKPIVTTQSEDQLGQVADIIIDQVHNRIAAFKIAKNEAVKDRKLILPWSGVQIAKADQVVATSHKMIVEARQIYEVKQILDRPQLTIGKAVVSITEENVGEIADVYFDELTGVIIGYQVLGEHYQDILGQSSFVSYKQIVEVTPDVVYVSLKDADQADFKGLEYAIQALQDHIASINFHSESTVRPVIEEGSDPVAISTALIHHWHLLVAVLHNILVDAHAFTLTEPEFQALIAKYTVDKLVGLPIRQDVYTTDESLVAVKGQRVSTAIITEAKNKNAVFNLMEAVGLDIEKAKELTLQ